VDAVLEPNAKSSVSCIGGRINNGESPMKRLLLLTAAMMLAGSAHGFAQDTVIVEVPQPARDYVIAHPSDPVVIEGDVAVGTAIPEAIELVPIPDSPDYAYIYVDKQPIIISRKDRKVVYLSQ
ncbi:MAG: DUF1236 domain-containing protein, partial [Phyllobacterium sp.]|uniref:DUF1236 domain-containing protein n=1 Tax=Phyllobacterium sp. TaxID=1871046 RepID=UPI0030F0F464